MSNGFEEFQVQKHTKAAFAGWSHSEPEGLQ